MNCNCHGGADCCFSKGKTKESPGPFEPAPVPESWPFPLPRATFDYVEDSYGAAVGRPQSDPDYLAKLIDSALTDVRHHQARLCPWLSRGAGLNEALNHLKLAELALERLSDG